jgi:DNA-binding transcriptional LysR family regulator
MPEPASGLCWEELRLFLQVAEAGSFHLAAQELGISHPTIARAVRRLENDLSTPLLIAHPRGAKLTPAGARLAGTLAKVDAEIAAAMRRVSQM